MQLEQRKNIYRKASEQAAASELSKVRKTSKDTYCNYETELINLINKIPNWESYLTDRQLQITQLFLGCRSAHAVDLHLKCGMGVAWHTLFGKGINSNEGVLNKLHKTHAKIIQLKDNRK